MEDPGDAGDFVCAGFAADAFGQLGGFGGDSFRLAGASRDVREAFADGGFQFGQRAVAGDGENHVVRRVVAAVVGHQVVARHRDENIAPADDGDAVGVDAEGGLPRQLVEHAVGVIFAHVVFAQNDFAFALPFIFGEGGIENGVRQDIQPHLPAFGGQGGVKHGAVV